MVDKHLQKTHWIKKYIVEILIVLALSLSSYMSVTVINNKTDIANIRGQNETAMDVLKEIRTDVKDIKHILNSKTDIIEFKDALKQIQTNKEDLIKIKTKNKK